MATKKVAQARGTKNSGHELPLGGDGKAHSPLVRVVSGDLLDCIQDLQGVFDDLIDAEFCEGAMRDALILAALKRTKTVRNVLGIYASKAVVS